MSFTNKEGKLIVLHIIDTIQKNKDYLSEIDGAIGDGDHGINMNKGVTIAKALIEKDENLSFALASLSQVLMEKIGGSMGPLYGSVFMGMQTALGNADEIDGECMQAMLQQAYQNIQMISPAKPGDKTLVDVLDPAVHAYEAEFQTSQDMNKALAACAKAAKLGMLETRNLQARLGRASRLKEKSIGHQDAGATSCCLILQAICTTAIELNKTRGGTYAEICE